MVAELSIRTAFNASFQRRVAGGLESRVEINTQLVDPKGSIVGRGGRSCKILYSLWDERVYVYVEDQGRRQPRVQTFGKVEPALKACGDLQDLPVALGAALTFPEGYRLRVRVVLNPVSEELVERSRQFITNPRGGARGRPNAVLGAVAGLFSRQGGALGDTYDFVGRNLDRPMLPLPSVRVQTPTQAKAVRPKEKTP